MKGNKIVLALSLLLAALVAFVSIVGITNPAAYAQETPNWQAQSKGARLGRFAAGHAHAVGISHSTIYR